MDEEQVIVSGVLPAMLPILDPAPVAVDIEPSEKDSAQLSADRLLSVASDIYSRWFLLMRSIMLRERVITRLSNEEATRRCYGELPYSKFPCVPQPLTAADEAAIDIYESIVNSAFGPTAASYAKESFLKAIHTGDKRSFKIRLLFFKSRDCLKNTPLYTPFSLGLEEYVSQAEEAAGCVPDPTPRRLSLAEQKRKKERESRPKQLNLFSFMDEEASNEDCPVYYPPNVPGDSKSYVDKGNVVDNKPSDNSAISNSSSNNGWIDIVLTDDVGQNKESDETPAKDSPDKVISDTRTILANENNAVVDSEHQVINNPSTFQHIENEKESKDARIVAGPTADSEFQYIEKKPEYSVNEPKKAKTHSKKHKNNTKNQKPTINVTKSEVNTNQTVNILPYQTGIIRKTKVYERVSEIISDIQDGRITPYTKQSEILEDFKSGAITPSEAVLFLAELGKRYKLALSSVGFSAQMSNHERDRMGALDDDIGPSSELDDIDDEDEDIENDSDNERDSELDLPSSRGDYGGFDGGGYDRSGMNYSSEDDW